MTHCFLSLVHLLCPSIDPKGSHASHHLVLVLGSRFLPPLALLHSEALPTLRKVGHVIRWLGHWDAMWVPAIMLYGYVLKSVHCINVTLIFEHYNAVVMFYNSFHSFAHLSKRVPSPERSSGDAAPPHHLVSELVSPPLPWLFSLLGGAPCHHTR